VVARQERLSRGTAEHVDDPKALVRVAHCVDNAQELLGRDGDSLGLLREPPRETEPQLVLPCGHEVAEHGLLNPVVSEPH
jgi:hypothetical protein